MTGKKFNGGIYQQSVRCGRTNCRCAKGEAHAGYFYIIWRHGSRQRKRYVPKHLVDQVREAIEAIREERRRERDQLCLSVGLLRELKGKLKNI